MNSFIWNPDPVAFTIPYLGRPVFWYGILFALAFFFAYRVVLKQLRAHLTAEEYSGEEVDKKGLGSTNNQMNVAAKRLVGSRQTYNLASKMTDKLSIWVVVGVVLGARLFHVFFYDFPAFCQRPFSLFNTWEGGLASHGGVIGAVLALMALLSLHKKLFSKVGLLTLLDMFVPAAAIMGVLIRCGNFINQEVLGKGSDLPWAVIFQNPIDGSYPIARHPVQLYEALFFLILFLLVPLLRKLFKRFHPGAMAGAFIALVFAFRFWVEDYKVEQSFVIDSSLNMGAWLSVPFIIVGLGLMAYAFSKNPSKKAQKNSV